MKRIIFGMALVILLLPSVQAFVWVDSCLNSTHLFKEAEYYFNDTLYKQNQTIYCEYGCDTWKETCYSFAGNPMPSEYFLLFEIFALILVMVAIKKVEENDVHNVFYSLMALILFMILALQGGNISTLVSETPVNVVFVVWINYGLALISLVLFIATIFLSMKPMEAGEK